MVGGLIRYFVEKRKTSSEKEKKDKIENGVLYSSGLIAGEGLIGILLAIFAIVPWKEGSLGDVLNLKDRFGINFGNIGGLIFFALLCGTLMLFINMKKKVKSE